MCGCYYYVFDKKASVYLEEVSSTLSLDSFTQGEIYPKDKALVFTLHKDKIYPCIKEWGFDSFHHKVIYNARYETYKEKPMFSSLERCVIACNGFFEWKKSKRRSDKIYVQKRSKELVFLAGLCNETHFVILTGNAMFNMKKIHARTPLILDETKMKKYLYNTYDPIVDNEELIFTLAK